MNPYGFLTPTGQFSLTSLSYQSQGYTYTMPYYGDSTIHYDFAIGPGPGPGSGPGPGPGPGPEPPGGGGPYPPNLGCLLSLLGIFR